MEQVSVITTPEFINFSYLLYEFEFLMILNVCIGMQALKSEDRRKILLDVADALEDNEDMIIAENLADIKAAEEVGYEKSLISRLALKPGRVL